MCARTTPAPRRRRSTRNIRARWTCGTSRQPLFVTNLQHREEGLLRDFHRADALHALLAFLLLLEQLALARDVAAVALGEHVLAQRLDRFARDDAGADRRLDGDLEHLPRDQLAHLRR